MKNHLCTYSVIVRDNKVLLGLRHYKEGSLWVPPGGRCEMGELPETALLREIQEEVGITDAKIVQKIGEHPGVYEDENGRDHMVVFEVVTNQEPHLMEPEKFEKWEWFTFDEIPENLINAKMVKEHILMVLKP